MKKTNKGFSLVELIIVIAIMAILAGAIAPALIKYIDKSRKSNDVSSAKTIKTAVETAMGTESVYEALVNTTGSVINIKPGEPAHAALSSDATAAAAIVITFKGDGGANAASAGQCAGLIGQNIGENTPKIKYKKATNGITPKKYVVTINAAGTVKVGLAGESGISNLTDTFIELAPEVDEDYQ